MCHFVRDRQVTVWGGGGIAHSPLPRAKMFSHDQKIRLFLFGHEKNGSFFSLRILQCKIFFFYFQVNLSLSIKNGIKNKKKKIPPL